jgi:hypothetical protein
MTTREVLIEARKVIEKPEDWTQGSYARGLRRRQCSPTSPRARQWCAEGACEGAALNTGTFGYRALVAKLEQQCSERVCDFNDSRSHHEVLGLFDRAIEAAEIKECRACLGSGEAQ